MENFSSIYKFLPLMVKFSIYGTYLQFCKIFTFYGKFCKKDTFGKFFQYLLESSIYNKILQFFHILPFIENFVIIVNFLHFFG